MVNPQDALWILSFGIGVVAAWIDWRKHEVPNFVWVIGFATALPLLAIEVFQEPVHALIRWGLFLLFFVVAYLLWRAGSFQAADAKGFSLFALILSPVGYYDLWHGKIYPALDVLVTALVLGWVIQRFTRQSKLPFFTVAVGPLLLSPVAGGLVWWPLVALLRFVVH